MVEYDAKQPLVLYIEEVSPSRLHSLKAYTLLSTVRSTAIISTHHNCVETVPRCTRSSRLAVRSCLVAWRWPSEPSQDRRPLAELPLGSPLSLTTSHPQHHIIEHTPVNTVALCDPQRFACQPAPLWCLVWSIGEV